MEELADTKGRFRISKSTDRQHNGQKKKDKRTNNDIQHITHNHNIVFVFIQHTIYLLQYNIHYIYYPFNIQLQLGINVTSTFCTFVEFSCSWMLNLLFFILFTTLTHSSDDPDTKIFTYIKHNIMLTV
jgi:hypothetical protein